MRSFTSRKSVLLGTFLWGILILVFLLTKGYSGNHAFIWILIYAFVGFIWFGLTYNLREHLLLIKIGPIQLMSVKISDITSIKRSFNPISSPAASLKRLKIDFKGGAVLISPKKEEEFIQALTNKNASIYVTVPHAEERSSFFTRIVYSLL